MRLEFTYTTLRIRLPEGMKETMLPNGEGIRWDGPVTEMKFKVNIDTK